MPYTLGRWSESRGTKSRGGSHDYSLTAPHGLLYAMPIAASLFVGSSDTSFTLKRSGASRGRKSRPTGGKPVKLASLMRFPSLLQNGEIVG